MGCLVMPVTSFACSECHTVLKPTKPVPEGKKVKCPKCGNIFQVTGESIGRSEAIQARKPQPSAVAAVTAEDEWEVVDDEPEEERDDEPVAARRRKRDDEEAEEVVAPRRRAAAVAEEDDEDDEPEKEDQPRKKNRKRFKPKKQKASSGSVLKWVLITGAASLLLVGGGTAIGVFFYLNKDKNKGTGNEELLAFVPQGTKMVMRFDWNAMKALPGMSGDLEQSLRRGFSPKFWSNVKEELGVDFQDFCEHVIVASKPSNTTFGDGGDSTLIIKTKAPFSQRKLCKAATEPDAQKLNGRSYFKINEPRFKILYMPSDNIAIFSSMPSSHVQFLIGSDPGKPMLAADQIEILHAADNNHFSISGMFNDSDRDNFKKLVSLAPAGSTSKEKTFFDSLSTARGFALKANVSNDQLDMTLAMHCGDSASAKKMAETAKSLYGLAGITGAIPKELAPLNKEISKSLAFGSQDRIATASGKVKAATFDKFMKDSNSDSNASGARSIGRLPTMNDLRGP